MPKAAYSRARRMPRTGSTTPDEAPPCIASFTVADVCVSLCVLLSTRRLLSSDLRSVVCLLLLVEARGAASSPTRAWAQCRLIEFAPSLNARPCSGWFRERLADSPLCYTLGRAQAGSSWSLERLETEMIIKLAS